MTILDELKATVKDDNRRFHSNSLEDTLKESVDKISKGIPKSDAAKASINDHYSNSLTGVGEADKIESFTNYGFSNDTLNWPLWLALYNDSWVFRRAIDKPAEDEVNCGFTLFGDENYSKIYKAFDKYKTDMTEILKWGALFGGSVGVIMFENVSDEEMGKPIPKEKIKGSRFKIYVTDRWYGVGETNNGTVDNMADIDFGKPKFYNITFADGHNVYVHHSYILRYEHRTAPKFVKNGQLQGWGYAEGSHILNELSRDDQLKASIQSLVNKSLIEVIKMQGMRGIFMGADDETQEQMRKRLEMVNWGRNFNSLTFLDKDDDYSMQGFSGITGLSDLLQQNMWLISSALEMQGILFGDLRGGLSTDNDALDRYTITIKNRCNTYYRPVLYKFLRILFLVYDVPGPVDFEFNSYQQKKENADMVTALQTYTSLLQTLVQTGVISKYQMAKSIQEYLTKGTIYIGFTEEQMNRLKYDEENEIIEAYKKRGKDAPDFDGSAGMGGMPGIPTPESVVETEETNIPETPDVPTEQVESPPAEVEAEASGESE